MNERKNNRRSHALPLIQKETNGCQGQDNGADPQEQSDLRQNLSNKHRSMDPSEAIGGILAMNAAMETACTSQCTNCHSLHRDGGYRGLLAFSSDT